MKFEKRTIDGHTHLYEWYDKNGNDFFSMYDNLQKNTGAKAMAISSITTRPYAGVDINMMAAIYKLHNPSAYAQAGIVYPSFPAKTPFPEGMESSAQYKELMELGFDGIKILFKPDVQKYIGLPMNDSYYNGFFAAAQKDNTPILWHIADPQYYWDKDYTGQWSYADGTYISYDETYKQVFDILDRYPKLNVIFAHFMFLSDRLDRLEEIFKKYENVKVDMTPGTEMYVNFNKDMKRSREFLEKYAGRLVFGTDAELPGNENTQNLMESVYEEITTDNEVTIWGPKVRGLKLSDSACDKILYSNFVREYGEKPKKISKDALKRYIEKYGHLIRNETNKKMILEYAKTL